LEIKFSGELITWNWLL